MIVLLVIAGYLISVAICYFGVRNLLIQNEWEPDWFIVFVIFIPVLNLIWGILGLFEGLGFSNRPLKRFFRLK